MAYRQAVHIQLLTAYSPRPLLSSVCDSVDISNVVSMIIIIFYKHMAVLKGDNFLVANLNPYTQSIKYKAEVT